MGIPFGDSRKTEMGFHGGVGDWEGVKCLLYPRVVSEVLPEKGFASGPGAAGRRVAEFWQSDCNVTNYNKREAMIDW